MSGKKYAVGESVPKSHRTPKGERVEAYKRDLHYAHGKRKTSSGRLTTGTWAYHATKGWRKRA